MNRLMSKALEATKQIPEDNWGELVYCIVSEALTRFRLCESEYDFCIQHGGCSYIIFGGHNRVIWTASGGFREDRDFCSERFLELWDEKYG